MAHRFRYVAAFIGGCALFLAACSGGGASTTNGNASPGNTTSAGNGPSSVPGITTPFCQSFMTTDQVNQILQLPSSDTIGMIVASGHNCDYNQANANPIFYITFTSYTSELGPLSQQIMVAVNLAKNNGATTFTQQVSGLGDQAEYLSTQGGIAKGDLLYVVKGNVEFVIEADDDTFINSPSDTAAIQEFQQIAQLVLAKL